MSFLWLPLLSINARNLVDTKSFLFCAFGNGIPTFFCIPKFTKVPVEEILFDFYS